MIEDLATHVGPLRGPATLLVMLGALALLPFALILLTSFVKIAVVLSIVRTAIGVPQVPPGPVITGLALVLTAVAMSPVASAVRERIDAEQAEIAQVSSDVERLRRIGAAALPPVADFLRRHGRPRDQALFRSLHHQLRPNGDGEPLGEDDPLVLVPAFLISELHAAFEIGFVLFVPFLVVDMVVANILLALGMQMLSPTTISLPFKLLLFVALDGWHRLAAGLVLGYAP